MRSLNLTLPVLLSVWHDNAQIVNLQPLVWRVTSVDDMVMLLRNVLSKPSTLVLEVLTQRNRDEMYNALTHRLTTRDGICGIKNTRVGSLKR